MDLKEYLPGLAALESAAAVVYRSMTPTPQYAWPLLAARLGTRVWAKHENHTPIGAFKIRGGLVYFDTLLRSGETVKEAISATRGNHGQSVSVAASRAGIKPTIVVPFGNSVEKNAAMRAFGAELIEHGADFQEAKEYAQALADERGAHMVPSFHPLLVRGVASYSLELQKAVPDLDVIYVPIGQGSGVCGMIAAREALGGKAEVVGVVSRKAPAYALSFEQRRAISHEATTQLADGMACRVPDEASLEVLWRHLARVVTVEDEEVAEAMRVIYSATHNVVEGAGAAAFAAALQEQDKLRGKNVAVVFSGGNVDRDIFAGVLGGN